jgi:hypothetical protein
MHAFTISWYILKLKTMLNALFGHFENCPCLMPVLLSTCLKCKLNQDETTYNPEFTVQGKLQKSTTVETNNVEKIT